MIKAIKFYADWCGPCRVYGKDWKKVEEELKEQVEFVEVNIENDTTGLAAQYKIKSIPFTVIQKNGEEIEKNRKVKSRRVKRVNFKLRLC